MKCIATRAFPVLLFVFALMLFSSCEEDGIIVSEHIKLKVEKNSDNGMKLTWNKVHISDYSHYEIYRFTTKPDLLHLEEYYYSSIHTVSNENQTTYTDYNYPISEELYYVVVARYPEKISNMASVKIEGVETIDQNISNAFFDNGSIYYLKSYYNVLKKYDIASSEVTHELELESAYGGVFCMSSYQGEKELLLGAGSWFYVVDAVNLTVKKKVEYNSMINGIASDNSGRIFISTYYNGISSILRSDFSTIGNYGSYYDEYNLFYHENSLYAIEDDSWASFNQFEVLSNGALQYQNGVNTGINGERTKFFPTIEKFVSAYDTKVLDLSGNVIGCFVYSDYNSVAYDVEYINSKNWFATAGYSEKKIKCYNVNNFLLEKTYSTLAQPYYIHFYNNILYSLGGSQGGNSNSYILEKIELN